MWRFAALSFLLVTLLVASANTKYIHGKPLQRFSLPANIMRPIGGEPSCEDLRVMWRFSRRQGRVSEITNEVPTYSDPFSMNMYEALTSRPRNMVASARSAARSWNQTPIYGTVVQNAPKNHPRLENIENARAYDDILRYFDNLNYAATRQGTMPEFRITGGMPVGGYMPLPQRSSFQHLKELIWEERAKDLSQQRFMEEAAALKNVQLLPQFARAFGKGRRSLFMPKDIGTSERNSPIYLPQEDGELSIPPPRYYMDGPTYRKSYRFQPVAAPSARIRRILTNGTFYYRGKHFLEM